MRLGQIIQVSRTCSIRFRSRHDDAYQSGDPSSSQAVSTVTSQRSRLHLLFGPQMVQTTVCFCCLSRAQPMYVQHHLKLSMYSQWKTSKELQHRCQTTLFEFNYIYNSITDGRMILTHLSYQSNRDRPTHQLILNWKQLKIYMLFRLLKSLVLLKLLIETLRTNHLGHRRSAEVILKQRSRNNNNQGFNSVQPKRLRIFPDGYIDKSTEEYTYVRGRGRGRYVYEECGIRCKKLSMLKKMHIVTTLSARWLRV